MGNIICPSTWQKMQHLGEPIHNNKESNPALVFGRPSTMSIERSFQGLVGIGNGVHSYILLCALEFLANRTSLNYFFCLFLESRLEEPIFQLNNGFVPAIVTS